MNLNIPFLRVIYYYPKIRRAREHFKVHVTGVSFFKTIILKLVLINDNFKYK